MLTLIQSRQNVSIPPRMRGSWLLPLLATPISISFLPLFNSLQPLSSLLHAYNIIISRMLPKWNHTVSRLWELAVFSENNSLGSPVVVVCISLSFLRIAEWSTGWLDHICLAIYQSKDIRVFPGFWLLRIKLQ